MLREQLSVEGLPKRKPLSEYQSQLVPLLRWMEKVLGADPEYFRQPVRDWVTECEHVRRRQKEIENERREFLKSDPCDGADANRDGRENANLIRRLQQEESKLVIETVAADLLQRFPGVCFVTLHDAIFCTAENLPRVEQAFQRSFDQHGFEMTFKTVLPKA